MKLNFSIYQPVSNDDFPLSNNGFVSSVIFTIYWPTESYDKQIVHNICTTTAGYSGVDGFFGILSVARHDRYSSHRIGNSTNDRPRHYCNNGKLSTAISRRFFNLFLFFPRLVITSSPTTPSFTPKPFYCVNRSVADSPSLRKRNKNKNEKTDRRDNGYWI